MLTAEKREAELDLFLLLCGSLGSMIKWVSVSQCSILYFSQSLSQSARYVHNHLNFILMQFLATMFLSLRINILAMIEYNFAEFLQNEFGTG